MSIYSETAANRARILQRIGDLQAEQTRGRGEFVGGLLSSLGQIPVQIQRQKQADAEQAQQNRRIDVQEQRAKRQDDLAGMQLEDATAKRAKQQQLEAELQAAVTPYDKAQVIGKYDPDKGEKFQTQNVQRGLSLIQGTPDGMTPEQWMSRKTVIAGFLGPDDASALPDQPPTKDQLRQIILQRSAPATYLSETKPPTPELMQGENPTNPAQPMMVPKVAGAVPYVAPKAANQDLVPTVGPDGKPIYGPKVAGAPVYERPRAPSASLTGPEGGLGQDAVDYTATQYRILGPSGIPTRIEAPDRVKILNSAAAQAKALGQTPANAVQKQSAYKADAGALTQMSKMKASAESYEAKALSQADLVSDLNTKVGRTQYPIINSALLAGKQQIAGDQDTQLLFNALQTFTSEYAKIMEGSTGSAAASSDAARKQASSLISSALSKGTLEATLQQMKREMRWTIDGYDATIGHITERMGGQPPTATAAPSVPTPTMRFNPATGKVEPIR